MKVALLKAMVNVALAVSTWRRNTTASLVGLKGATCFNAIQSNRNQTVIKPVQNMADAFPEIIRFSPRIFIFDQSDVLRYPKTLASPHAPSKAINNQWEYTSAWSLSPLEFQA